MKERMKSVRSFVPARGAAIKGNGIKSVRNMYRESDTVIVKKTNAYNTKRLDEMLGEVMMEAAARGWGDDWKFVAPAWGGIAYYGVRNPIKQANRKLKNKKA